MLLLLCIVLFVLTAIAYPLHFHIEGRLDVFVNGGEARVYFFGVRIFKVKLRLEQDPQQANTIYIESFNKTKILGQVNLNANINDRRSIVRYMTGSVLGNVNVSDCFVNVEIGRKSDAIFTAMGLSMVRMAYCAFMSYVKSWQKIRTRERFVPLYDKNVFIVEFLGIFSFNLADIIYGTVANLISRHNRQIRKDTKSTNIKF